MRYRARPPSPRPGRRGSLLAGLVVGLSVVLGAAPASALPPPAGEVQGWGPDLQGPIPSSAASGIRAVAAGSWANLAVTDAGTVLAWGNDGWGQLDVPTSLADVVEVAVGGRHAMAREADGTVVTWGTDSHGQLPVPGGLTARSVAAGPFFSLAARTDGTVAAWGNNADGQTTVPGGLSNVVQVAAGASHSVALRADGTVVAWGSTFNNQTQVPGGLTGVVAVSAAYNYSLALKDDGTVVSWGRPGGGASVPAGLDDVVAISAGYHHALALKDDGTVVAWGSGTTEISGPAGLTGGAIAVSATSGGSLVLVGVEPEAPTATSGVAPATATVGTPYSHTFAATGTPAPTFAVTAGSLPAGLTLDSATGVLSGTPAAAGSATFTVSAANGVGSAAQWVTTLTVAPQAPVAPGSVTATAGTSQLEVGWTASAGGPVTRYVVTASPGDVTCTTNGLTCLLGVEAGRAYEVTVTAEGPGGVRVSSTAVRSAVVPAPQTASAPPADAPQTLSTPEGALTTASPGEEVTLVATGYLPGSTVSFVVYSTPVVLGTAVADGSGTARLAVALPASLEAGDHSVVAYGVSPDGSARATRMDFAVAAVRSPSASTGALAYTGSAPVAAIALAATTLLVLGGGLVLFTRRRHTA